MLILKVGKEIKCTTHNKDVFKFLIYGVYKDKDGNIVSISLKPLDNTDNIYEYTVKDFYSSFISIQECITSTEFFTMYTNWNNFNRKGILQDLNYANEVKEKINNSLNLRDIVRQGSGKFEEYDYKLLNIFLGDD